MRAKLTGARTLTQRLYGFRTKRKGPPSCRGGLVCFMCLSSSYMTEACILEPFAALNTTNSPAPIPTLGCAVSFVAT
jgi:hypothetical protein